MVSPTATALGVAGMVPLLGYGLLLDTWTNWEWVRKIDEATSEVALQLFGSKRQVIFFFSCRAYLFVGAAGEGGRAQRVAETSLELTKVRMKKSFCPSR